MNEFVTLLDKLPKETRNTVREMFANAPYWVLEAFHVVHIPSGTMFVKAGDPAKTIYLLIEGRVKATDLGIDEVVYDYTSFEAVELFGAMEFYMGVEGYITSLVTRTECKMLEISTELFKRWVLSDPKVMLQQTRNIMKRLNSQSQKERYFLFLNAEERVCYFFVNYFRENERNGVWLCHMTKSEIANIAAIHVRTVTRVIQALEKQQLLTRDGWTIQIDQEQCEQMEHILKKKEIQRLDIDET
ncbi:MAG: Crp/Fnr family transcriptional regulator [Bariatricus sp.]